MATPALTDWTSQAIPSTPRLRCPSVSRDIVLWLDTACSGPGEPDKTWSSLIRGECTVDDAFCDAERAYLVLRRAPYAGRLAEALERRPCEMLRRLVLGQSQKAISIDMGLTPSTVAVSLGRCMQRLGLSCRAQNLPLALALIGQAAHDPNQARAVRVSAYESEHQRYEVVSVGRPDLALPAVLSLAEQAIARHVVEGTAHGEVARSRGTSRRTIANQLSAIFKKLGASGRFELMRTLSASGTQRRLALALVAASGG